jgi:hypothetical protein
MEFHARACQWVIHIYLRQAQSLVVAKSLLMHTVKNHPFFDFLPLLVF